MGLLSAICVIPREMTDCRRIVATLPLCLCPSSNFPSHIIIHRIDFPSLSGAVFSNRSISVAPIRCSLPNLPARLICHWDHFSFQSRAEGHNGLRHSIVILHTHSRLTLDQSRRIFPDSENPFLTIYGRNYLQRKIYCDSGFCLMFSEFQHSLSGISNLRPL